MMLEVWLSTYIPRALGAPPRSGVDPRARVTGAPSYVCLTPARDEAANLPRLAASLAAQTVRPRRWTVIDNGSRDGTAAVVRGLARRHPWIALLEVEGDPSPVRGAPIVRALHAGIAAIEDPPDVVVNLDADISFDPDYFARLLARFVDEPALGITSGTCYERENGEWRQRHVTGTTVWGASRAWRWECLQQVLPLEERLGWDGIDEFKANARGWSTRTCSTSPSTTTGPRAPGTAACTAPASPRAGPPTTWATARGTSPPGRSGSRCATRRRSR